jgi:hypothetical protein
MHGTKKISIWCAVNAYRDSTGQQLLLAPDMR